MSYTHEQRLAVLARVDEDLERMLRADWPTDPEVATLYLGALHRVLVSLHTAFFHFLTQGDMEQRAKALAAAAAPGALEAVFHIGEPVKLSALFVEKGREHTGAPSAPLVPGGEA